MVLSAEFSVDGNSAIEAIEVSYGATVTLAALSQTFNRIEWSVSSTSKSDMVAPTITRTGTPNGVTATFVQVADPGDGLGRALVVKCTQYDSQGNTSVAYRVIGTVNSQGSVPFCADEWNYRNATHGWTELMNHVLNASGGGGGISDHGGLTGLTDSNDHMWAELVARPLSSYSGAAATAVLADARKHITTSHGSANTFTIPPNASVAFATATLLWGTNIGAGTMTLTAGAGVTLNGSTAVAANGWWWAKKTNADTWQTFVGGAGGGSSVVAGNGLTDTAGTFSVDAADVTLVVGAAGVKRAPITGDATIADGSNVSVIANLALSKLATQAALSVVANATNATAVPTAVAAGSDGLVFLRSGTALIFGTIATAGITDAAVTYAKIQDVSAASRLLGRGSAAGAGDLQELTVSGGIEFSGTVVQRSALAGDVTAPAGSNTTTIAANAVTTSKILDANVTDAKLASVFIKANGTVAFSAAQSMGGFKLTSLGTPTLSTDAATKAYVDGVASGLYVKSPVDVVSTTNIASLSGLATTIDGVLQNVDSKRVLLTGQTTASQNGPWEVHSGAWTRPTDFAAGSDAASAFFFVQRGTTFADTGWVCTADAGSAVVGTNNLPFVQFSAAGVTTVDASLVKTGNQLSRAALTGDATAPAGSNVTTITNLAVTKLAPSGTNGRVLVTAAGVATWGFALGNSTDAFTYNGLTHTFSVAGSAALAINSGAIKPSVPAFTFTSAVVTPVVGVDTRTSSSAGELFRFEGQDIIGTGAGGEVRVRAGNSTAGPGGHLEFWSGDGTTDGSISFRTGGTTTQVEITPTSVTIGDGSVYIEVATLATDREIVSLLHGTALTTTQMPANTGDKVIYVADTTTKPTTGFPFGGGILYSDINQGLSWKGARGVETTIAPHGDVGNVTKRRMIGFKTDPKRTTLTSTTTTTVASFSVDLLNSQAVTTGSFKIVAHFIATGNSYGACGERMALLEVTAGTPTVHTVQDSQTGTNSNGSPYTAIVIDSTGTTVRLRMTASTVALNVEVFAYFEIMEFEP